MTVSDADTFIFYPPTPKARLHTADEPLSQSTELQSRHSYLKLTWAKPCPAGKNGGLAPRNPLKPRIADRERPVFGKSFTKKALPGIGHFLR
jgi:hypothetical protein